MKAHLFDRLASKLGKADRENLQHFLQQLARQQTILETIANAMQEGILVADREARIRFLNTSAARLLGLDPASSAGMGLGRVIRGVDWEAMRVGGQSVSRDIEVSYPQRRYLNFYVLPLPEEGGEGESFAVILRDVTEARKFTEEAVESERVNALRLLSASLAHELGNPLNSLGIHLQLIERDARRLPKDQAAPVIEGLRVCKEEIKRLDHIITQFLQAVRPTEPDLRLGDVNVVVEESVTFLRPELDDKEVLVEMELDRGIPRVLIDPVQLKQAFYNIIRNALQAVRSGGILRISTAVEGDFVSVAFTDNGGGIPPERLANIFQPFYTTKKKGSGLGLMIVRRIAREHGGEIAIESHLDRGTTVRLLLPARENRIRLLQVADA